MKRLGRILTALVFVFLYAPLLVMMLFSFNESKSTSVFTGFSLKWYMEVFTNSSTLESLSNTLLLAFLSATIAIILGTMAANGIFRLRSRLLTNVYTTVTNIPMMNPDIVTGVSLMLLFVFIGRMISASNSLSFVTLLIAHITFCLPYAILSVLPKLQQTDPNLINAALDLGCTPMQAFFKVTLPAISPGIFSGWLISLTLSLDDFVISYYTNGTGFQTLPLKIYSMTKKTVKPDMYALSTMIFLTVFILLLVINMTQLRMNKQTNNFAKGVKETE